MSTDETSPAAPAPALRTEDLGGGVAALRICRPPHNYFDESLIAALATTSAELAAGRDCRAIVLCSEGRNFCAGADLSARPVRSERPLGLYDWALDLFACELPIVAAVQGSAIGGGLGLALVADFRVGAESTRFVANFARLGFNQGFAITETLPAVVGQQRAREILLTATPVDGVEAFRVGLLDRLVPEGDIEQVAAGLAGEIAANAPLAVRAIRRLASGDRVDRLRAAIESESREQRRLMTTEDFREGVRAVRERRAPQFTGIEP